jgi:hypothetical protein
MQLVLEQFVLCGQLQNIGVLLLNDSLDSVDLQFRDVDVLLLLVDGELVLLVGNLLLICHAIQLLAHVLDLSGLGVVDVGLAGDLLQAFLVFQLRFFVVIGHLTFGFLGFSQLDFDVTERVFEFFVLQFAQSEHLFVLDLCALLSVHSQATTSTDAVSLNKYMS